MYFSELITLKKKSTSLDTYGDATKTYTDTDVFANKKSVTRSEFYAANMAGIKIDTIFEVHAEDFDDQTYIAIPSKAAIARVRSATITDFLEISATNTLGATANSLKVLLTTKTGDTLSVTKTEGTSTINIALANTTPTKNTAALIQTAIRALSTVGGISVTGLTCAANGLWDTAAKATGESASVSFSGGITASSVYYEVIRAYQKGEGNIELMCIRREVV